MEQPRDQVALHVGQRFAGREAAQGISRQADLEGRAQHSYDSAVGEASATIVVSTIVTFPVLAWQLYRFVAPGLYRRERKAFMPFLMAAPVLFLGALAVLCLLVSFVLRWQAAASGPMLRRRSSRPAITMWASPSR